MSPVLPVQFFFCATSWYQRATVKIDSAILDINFNATFFGNYVSQGIEDVFIQTAASLRYSAQLISIDVNNLGNLIKSLLRMIGAGQRMRPTDRHHSLAGNSKGVSKSVV